MAKLINGLLGNSRNKIGSIVTYVSKGQQIARSKAANISNPRTASQMTQRIRLSNVVAMYRANKGWLDRYAFENKPTRWSVFNAFVSANLSVSLVALTKQEAAAGACVVAPYKMTDGSLPQIQINEIAEAGVFTTDLYIGDLVIDSATTIGELSAALIANNNGIVQGMQLSLIENAQQVVNNIPRVVCRAYEFIINSSDDTPLSEKWSSAGVTTYTEGVMNAIAYDTMEGETAFTFVLSHTYGGKTHVGASYMVLNDPAVYESYTSSTAVDLAIQSYGSGNNTPFLDSTEAGSAGESGDSGDVPLNPTILSVAVAGASATTPTFKQPGSYLGGFGGETNVRVIVQLSTAVPVANLRDMTVIVGTGGQDNTATINQFTVDGREVTATFAAVPVNPTYPISTVYLNTDYGVLQAEFSTTDPGVTE